MTAAVIDFASRPAARAEARDHSPEYLRVLADEVADRIAAAHPDTPTKRGETSVNAASEK